MALINCNNCGQKISDKAPKCPKCGAAFHVRQQYPPVTHNQYEQKSSSSSLKVLLIIGGIIIAILIAILICITIIGGEEKKEEERVTISRQDSVSLSLQDSLINQSSSTTQGETRQAYVINDADGWTNIRTSPSSKASIVDKVYDGTVFYVTDISGSKWCKFYWDQTSPSVGYIYKKYIKPVGSSKTPPNQPRYRQEEQWDDNPTGKYHVIVSSHYTYTDAEKMQRKVSNSGFDGEIIYSSQQNTYRVSAYSTYNKSEAKRELGYIKDYYPQAWIAQDK